MAGEEMLLASTCLRIIFKAKDLFYEDGDNFQENPVLQLFREFF